MKIPKGATHSITKTVSKSLGKLGQSSKELAKAAKSKAGDYIKKNADKVKNKHKSFTDVSSEDDDNRVHHPSNVGKLTTHDHDQKSKKHHGRKSFLMVHDRADSSDADMNLDEHEHAPIVRKTSHHLHKNRKRGKIVDALKNTTSSDGLQYQYQLFLVILFLLAVTSLIGIVFIPLGDQIAKRYSWSTYESKVPTLIVTFGLASVTALLLVLVVVLTQLNQLKNGRGNTCLIIIIVIAFIFSLVAFICSMVQYSQLDSVFGEEFEYLAQDYQKDLGSRIILDTVQIEFECCGIESYTDWKEIQSYGKGSIPFSCCDVTIQRPCVHEDVESGARTINYRFPKDLTIYQNGCRQAMQQYYKEFLVVAISLSSIYLILEIILFAMSFFNYK